MEGRAHDRLRCTRILAIIVAAAVTASAAMAIRSRRFVAAQAGARGRELAAGKILVARRTLADPNFAETVILLVQYDEKGTVGLILNRQTKVPLSRLSRELPGAKGRSDPVYLGGPVETSGLLALVRARTKPEDAKHVLNDVYMISTKTALEKAMASGAAANTFRLYVGYAGWDAGQLEWELGMAAWDVLPPDTSIVFDPHPETLWPRLVEEEQLQRASAGQSSPRPAAPPLAVIVW